MASAWGTSWGSAWGDSWGAAAVASTPAPPVGEIGDDPPRTKGGWPRRRLTAKPAEAPAPSVTRATVRLGLRIGGSTDAPGHATGSAVVRIALMCSVAAMTTQGALGVGLVRLPEIRASGRGIWRDPARPPWLMRELGLDDLLE